MAGHTFIFNYNIFVFILFRNYEDVIRKKEKPIFDSSHIQRFSPATSPSNCTPNEIKKCGRIFLKTNKKVCVTWTLDNICKAAQLLKKPPENVEFSNEHDMRKVYSLVYDVFRCKYFHMYNLI